MWIVTPSQLVINTNHVIVFRVEDSNILFEIEGDAIHVDMDSNEVAKEVFQTIIEKINKDYKVYVI